jgi:hypothetical protein
VSLLEYYDRDFELKRLGWDDVKGILLLLIDEGKICSSVYVPRYIDFWQSREMSE